MTLFPYQGFAVVIKVECAIKFVWNNELTGFIDITPLIFEFHCSQTLREICSPFKFCRYDYFTGLIYIPPFPIEPHLRKAFRKGSAISNSAGITNSPILSMKPHLP